MTVQTTASRVSYDGAGSAGPFTVPFYFIADEDIRAVKVLIADGTETELALSADFTLTGAGDEDGGALTLTDVLAADYRLVIFRDPEILQEADYPANDPFPSATHEQVVDRLTMVAQRQSDLLGRAVVQPDGDEELDMRLPSAVERASTYLAFDADGKPIASTGTGTDSGLRGDLADSSSAVLGDALIGVKQPITGAAARTLHDKLIDIVSAKDMGAEMDGATDDIAALNASIAALNSGAVSGYFLPDGVMIISAKPDPITADDIGIFGNGPGATQIKRKAGSGTDGTFFTLGTALVSADRVTISGIMFDCLNAASLTGGCVFDIVNSADVFVDNVIAGAIGAGKGVAGLAKLGDSAAGTLCRRSRWTRCDVNLEGRAELACMDIQYANGTRMNIVRCSVNTASVTGAVKGIWCHPEDNNKCDSLTAVSCEFNMPGGNVKDIVVLDATDGRIGNFFFITCVFDHSLESAIRMTMPSGSIASAHIQNCFFTACRAEVDGDSSIIIDNTGNRDMRNIQFTGGYYSAYDLAAVQLLGTSTLTDCSFVNVMFHDVENTTPKYGISCAANNLRVIGCKFQSKNDVDACTFTYGVGFTDSAVNVVITDNDCSKCTVGVADTDLFGVANADTRRIENNVAPNIGTVQYVPTTDATVTTLATITLNDARTYIIEADVIGTSGSDRAAYKIAGAFYRTGGGSATQQGATASLLSAESDAAWDAAFDTNGNSVRLRVTGKNATNIKWGAVIRQRSRAE